MPNANLSSFGSKDEFSTVYLRTQLGLCCWNGWRPNYQQLYLFNYATKNIWEMTTYFFQWIIYETADHPPLSR